MVQKIAIIDVSSYIFRAFHAIPAMTSPKGEQVNSIYGFISMFLKIMEKFNGYSVVAALDSRSATFRKTQFPAYKANRKEVDPDLKCQFTHIDMMLDALQIPKFSRDGFEADDIIASIIRQNPLSEVVIISSDKDLMQLIDAKKLMYDSMKDKIIDSEAVKEKFGVYPEKMYEFLSLTGDSSDNVPGIPGIGPKTASVLLNEYGSIENIYKNLDSLKPAMKSKFIEHRELLEISKSLINLITDIDIDSNNLPIWNGVNKSLFIKFANEMGFRSLLRKTGLDSTPEISGQSLFSELKPWIEKEFIPGEKEEYFGVLFNDNFYLGQNGFYIPFEIIHLPKETVIYSFDVKSFLNYPFPQEIKFIDMQIAYFCHNSGRHSYSFDELGKLFGLKPEKIDTAGLIFSFLEKLKEKISSMEDKSFLINSVEMPNLEIIRLMEQTGIKVDKEKLIKLRQEFQNILDGLSKEIASFAGADFNPNSPRQLAEILFEKLKLPSGRKTKTGFSTEHSILNNLTEMNIHPLPGLIIKNREFAKLVSTYLDPILLKTEPDNRLRTTFIVTHAATGRLASREPNLQNIPVKTDEGKKIREIFIAEKGNCLLSLDYSQVELRILASMSGENEFIDAFKNGEDIHTKTASAIFQTIPEMVDSSMRRHAKAVNFGIIYGMQAYKLSVDTGVDISFAKKYIDNYFACYPKVKNFINTIILSAKDKGYVETLLKRRRYIPEISHSNRNISKSGERMAVNTVIQGSAADIIKMGTIAVHKMLLKKCPEARILLQIHDELIIELPENKTDIAQYCADEMIKAGALIDVPLGVNFSTGFNWAELK